MDEGLLAGESRQSLGLIMNGFSPTLCLYSSLVDWESWGKTPRFNKAGDPFQPEYEYNTTVLYSDSTNCLSLSRHYSDNSNMQKHIET